ncbi:MAG: polysaccharide biosynthesis C-terminal domain-containing protein [Flavobacteriales bacterium]|nr:polysaccharide biosynthesis C-terminal domain-containing protein [Flavobacteriales bacterium]
MQRLFLSNLLLLLVLNLLVKPFYILGIDAGVQQAVGSASYGGYAALLSLSFLLNIVLDLGITNYNTRNIAQHGQLMAKYLGGMAGVRALLMVFYALLTVGAAWLLGYRDAALGMLGWLVLNQALAASILYLRSNIAGAQRFRQDALLSVLDRLLLIGLVGWLLWGRASGTPFRIEWFVYAQTAAYGATLIAALLLTLRLSGRVRPRWRPAFGWMVVRQSLPYALLILLMTFYYRTDMLMLERMLPDGDTEAGIYAQGFRFFEAFNMLGFLVAGLLLPMFSRMLKEGEDVAPLAMLAFRLVLAGALAVAVFAWPHAREVMDLRYAEHTERSAPAFALLMACFVAVCVSYVFGTLLTARGDLGLLNRMAAAGAVLNIGLNALLIPRWQAEGAAWASLLTQGATAVVQVVLAVRAFRMQAPWGVILRAMFYAAGLLAMVLVARHLGLALGWSFAIHVPMAVALAFLVRCVRMADLRMAFTMAPARGGQRIR